MEPELLSFPVWVCINRVNRPGDEGYPFYLMIRGGHGTPVPATVPIFTSGENAQVLNTQPPFEIVQMDKAQFHEALSRCDYVEYVTVDMTTNNAKRYRAEDLLQQLTQ
jgi:hypothetical protein